MKNLHEYIKFEFIPNNTTYKASEFIIGTITIQALKDFSVDAFGVYLKKRIKGQLSTPPNQSFSITNIIHENIWRAGQIYEYNIEILIPENAYSYSGENVEVLWAIVFELDPSSETSSTLRKDFLKNVEFHSLFKSFSNFKHEYYINILPKEDNYEIIPIKNSLANNNKMFIILGVIILIIATCIFLFLDNGFFFGLIITGLGGYVLYKNIYHTISIGKLGKITYSTHLHTDDEFMLRLRLSNNQRSIKKLNYYCSITEKVRDDRGTSTTTRSETVYKSPKNTFKQSIKKDNELLIPYPKKSFPIDIDINDVELIWNVNLDFEFKNDTTYIQKLPIKISKS
ncbi:hypothetical protein [Pseudofulvibacter geojedonensis]|uniref:Arrestin-like N-terminal domain-containing protein n=1 Tax=Pseudofulvibacter geojedonensis TaxID=1123758 RepID=A0ABW3HYT0_9FLAO